MADPPAISSATVRDHVDVVQSAALRELLLVIDFQEDTLIAAADRVAAPPALMEILYSRRAILAAQIETALGAGLDGLRGTLREAFERLEGKAGRAAGLDGGPSQCSVKDGVPPLRASALSNSFAAASTPRSTSSAGSARATLSTSSDATAATAAAQRVTRKLGSPTDAVTTSSPRRARALRPEPCGWPK